MGTSLTVDDLPQVFTRESDGKSRLEYRFKVDDADFALTGDGSLIILGRCALCTELVPAGRIPLHIDIAIQETGGRIRPRGHAGEDRRLHGHGGALLVSPGAGETRIHRA